MVPRHNRVFCGQETTLPRDTGFDNKWYSHSHQPKWGTKTQEEVVSRLFLSSKTICISYKHLQVSVAYLSPREGISDQNTLELGRKLSFKMAVIREPAVLRQSNMYYTSTKQEELI